MLKVAAIDVDEDRARADRSDGPGRRGEREGRHEHRVARLHLQRHQGDHQCVAAARHGDRVFGAGISGQTLLEQSNLWAEDELAVAENRVDPRLDIAIEALPLALEVEERDAVVVRDRKGRCGAGRRHYAGTPSMRAGATAPPL